MRSVALAARQLDRQRLAGSQWTAGKLTATHNSPTASSTTGLGKNDDFQALGSTRMDDKERRDRLVEWLEAVFKDVQDLLLDDYIFWALQKVIGANPRFTEASGLFTQWMALSFVQATAVGVRRQAKINDDSFSLARVLAEIERYPSLVSRRDYIGLFDGSEKWLREIGERDFDTVAGVGNSEIPQAVVQQHIAELKAAVASIEHYVDRRVAHYDKRGLAQPTPTLDDLSGALRTMEKLVILYWRLLKGQTMSTMVHTITFDWQDIFLFPWICR
jgi:hypothetical protein